MIDLKGEAAEELVVMVVSLGLALEEDPIKGVDHKVLDQVDADKEEQNGR